MEERDKQQKESNNTSSEKKSSGKKMKRTLGVPAVFAICSGAMYSSGFFLLPGLAAEETGPSLPLVYLLATVLMLPAIFSMAELGSAMPRAGGPYFFLNRSLGPLLGIIGAFGKYLQMVLKGAFAFVGVGIYLSLVMDLPRQPVAIALIVGFTFLNLVGTRQTARTEIMLVGLLLVLLTYFLVAGIVQVMQESTELQEEFSPLFAHGFSGFISAVALVFVSYGGIGQVASVAEEIKKPSHAMPRGMLYALGVSLFFYLLGTSIMIALVSSGTLRGDSAPVATAAENFSALPLPVVVIVIAALAGFASAGNAAIFSATRYPLALARDRLIWSGFGKLDSKGVPRTSVIATGTIMVLLVIAFDVKAIAKLASAFLLFVFMGMCVAVAIFRESRIQEYKPGFRSPLYPWVQIFGIIVYIGLIGVSGLKSVGFILAMCLLGGLWHHFGLRRQPKTSAAIYELFGRMAQKSQRVPARKELGVPMLGGMHLRNLLEQAIIIDLKQEKDYDKVVQRASEALSDHLGGRGEEIEKHLHDEMKNWLEPVQADVAIAPVLLQGIEQPELVVVRGRFTVGDQSLHGLIALVDDENHSSRLLELLSQLEATIFHTDFAEDWKEARNAEELKESLIQDVGKLQTLDLRIEDSGPTAKLKDCSLQEVRLPEGSLVIMIRREGKLLVPRGETTFHAGDEVTLVAQAEAMKKLKEQFQDKEMA